MESGRLVPTGMEADASRITKTTTVANPYQMPEFPRPNSFTNKEGKKLEVMYYIVNCLFFDHSSIRDGGTPVVKALYNVILFCLLVGLLLVIGFTVVTAIAAKHYSSLTTGQVDADLEALWHRSARLLVINVLFILCLYSCICRAAFSACTALGTYCLVSTFVSAFMLYFSKCQQVISDDDLENNDPEYCLAISLIGSVLAIFFFLLGMCLFNFPCILRGDGTESCYEQRIMQRVIFRRSGTKVRELTAHGDKFPEDFTNLPWWIAVHYCSRPTTWNDYFDFEGSEEEKHNYENYKALREEQEHDLESGAAQNNFNLTVDANVDAGRNDMLPEVPEEHHSGPHSRRMKPSNLADINDDLLIVVGDDMDASLEAAEKEKIARENFAGNRRERTNEDLIVLDDTEFPDEELSRQALEFKKIQNENK